ncbi:MAG: DUF429 domain-containing protein [Saprospiraceae bacterium]
MEKNQKYTVGIDGCKYGWIAIKIRKDTQFSISKHSEFSSIFKEYPDAEKYLVDMVIGLADKNHPREVEFLARQKLKPNHTSSVFTPPCRAAVYEKTYEAAKEKNKTILGKSFSIQAWNIVPKIKEVDEFILKNHEYQNRIFEAHPEVCFASLNNQIPMIFKKKEKEGIEERINLLQVLFPKSKEIFEKGNIQFLKKEVKSDDLIDSLSLAVTGYLGMKYGFDFLISKEKKQDIYGLEMNMIFFINNSLGND